MHIIYAVTACSDRVYRQLFAQAKEKPSSPAPKYHRLLIEGLAASCKVDVLANPPVNRKVLDRAFVPIQREVEAGACYRYIPAIRNPALKALFVGLGTFFGVLTLAGKDSAVLVDPMNRVTSLAALLAARLRGKKCVSIVTDVPDLYGRGSLGRKISNLVIGGSTHYLFLTEAMNGLLNPKGKPYVVLEGHADISMEELNPSLEQKKQPPVVLYAGAANKQYGLENLVKGFQMASIPEARLEIYGAGDYTGELEQIGIQDPRIHYGGMLLYSQVVEKELSATLLVNPRPTDEEYVKYSFPSKTMEYMASGTPVLTTRLPGMPREYGDHVYFIDQETPEGVAQALEQVLNRPARELHGKGMTARNFVLKERNNVVQAKKLLDLLK